MSDRIDELMAEAEFFNDNGCDKCAIVTELATIAREAEAEVKRSHEAILALTAEADKWRDRPRPACEGGRR